MDKDDNIYKKYLLFSIIIFTIIISSISYFIYLKGIKLTNDIYDIKKNLIWEEGDNIAVEIANFDFFKGKDERKVEKIFDKFLPKTLSKENS